MQHRGQEGAGMVTFDEDGNSCRHRGLGLLNEVFDNKTIAKLKGSIGIGNVRYANADPV